ncbi:MAG: SDR family oxidoreductase [Deltaproteobacteria bacterium]|jgi:NADP-dependent 3-hydroxy acid dehydrogenase YdfG|nr:SDR family oxidoreductase [Deltaproteobacteria bacterium]MCW8893936.1 SDR family oxidoreductase [Deltaproteobacteria bacterium]MCW9049124.1 SDR family oxidoreductase [Deltaproteobacteria bacterium]
MAKTILITGATAGFGKACAEYFAEQGWQLILTGRRTGRLEQLKEQLGDAVQQIITLDVRDRDQVFEKLGSLSNIDVLLNNAGLALGLEPSWEVDINDWETMVDTNIKGLMYCIRAVLPAMVTRNSGHVINIGSTAGSWPYPGGNVYGGTKAFVQQLSRNLRADLLGSKVRVTNLAPGMAESEFSNVRFKGDDAAADKVYAGADPLIPEDIAEIVYWIANRPAHININAIEVMPVDQAWGPLAVHRVKG